MAVLDIQYVCLDNAKHVTHAQHPFKLLPLDVLPRSEGIYECVVRSRAFDSKYKFDPSVAGWAISEDGIASGAKYLQVVAGPLTSDNLDNVPVLYAVDAKTYANASSEMWGPVNKAGWPKLDTKKALVDNLNVCLRCHGCNVFVGGESVVDQHFARTVERPLAGAD